MANAIASCAGLILAVIMAVSVQISHFAFGINPSGLGPVSGLLSGLVAYIACYFVLDFGVGLLPALFWFTIFDEQCGWYKETDKKDLLQKFLQHSQTIVKLGIIKNFPMLLGIATGVIIRLCLKGVFLPLSFVRRIKIAPKNGAAA